MLDTATIHICKFHHPQENLPAGNRPWPEAEFADRFAVTYQQRYTQVHPRTTKRQTLFVREVAVSGYGIADLVVLSWSDKQELSRTKSVLRSFELKVSNWRKGLMQAHRYGLYSHASVLVVPSGKLKSIRQHINLFQRLRVGLWGFDQESGVITREYTPRPRHAKAIRPAQLAFATLIAAGRR